MNYFLTKEISTKFTDIIPLFLFSFTSIHTRRAYLNDLKTFTEFIKKYDPNIHGLTQINEFCLTAWKNELEKTLKLSPVTVRRKLNCLSALFEFAKKRKYVDTNPVLHIKKPPQTNLQNTNALSQEEMLKVFESIEQKITYLKTNSDSDKYAQRKLHSLELHYTIFHLLCSTGLRVSEVCKLKLNDLEVQKSLENSVTYILHIKKAKGSIEHKVFLNHAAAQVLLKYKEKYRDSLSGEKPFFVRVQNKSYVEAEAITSRAVYDMIKSEAKDANITKKISPHSIRAGVATILHSKGVPLARIQKQLGHSDIATTSVYIKKANEVEESAALKLNLEDI